MYMIEMTCKCKCGNKELTTHQSVDEPVGDELEDIVYGYCSECGNELSDKIKNCIVYYE